MGRPPIGKQAMTGSERQRRYLDRLLGAKTDKDADRLIAELRAQLSERDKRIAELKAEVAMLKAAAHTQPRQPPPLPRTPEELAAAKARRTAEISAQRAAAKAAKLAQAAAERPDADVPTLLAENDKLKQQMKATQTRIRNITAELRHTRQWHEQEMAKKGGMSFAAQNALFKVLHPDQRANATEADLDKACKLFTAWKADKDKARRG